jgi:hypothetical protein
MLQKALNKSDWFVKNKEDYVPRKHIDFRWQVEPIQGGIKPGNKIVGKFHFKLNKTKDQPGVTVYDTMIYATYKESHAMAPTDNRWCTPLMYLPLGDRRVTNGEEFVPFFVTIPDEGCGSVDMQHFLSQFKFKAFIRGYVMLNKKDQDKAKKEAEKKAKEAMKKMKFKKPNIKAPNIKAPKMGCFKKCFGKIPCFKKCAGLGKLGKIVPKVKMPNMKMPNMKMPNMKMPDMPNMPNIKMPELPDLPDVNLPDVDWGKVNAPDFKFPKMRKISFPDPRHEERIKKGYKDTQYMIVEEFEIPMYNPREEWEKVPEMQNAPEIELDLKLGSCLCCCKKLVKGKLSATLENYNIPNALTPIEVNLNASEFAGLSLTRGIQVSLCWGFAPTTDPRAPMVASTVVDETIIPPKDIKTKETAKLVLNINKANFDYTHYAASEIFKSFYFVKVCLVLPRRHKHERYWFYHEHLMLPISIGAKLEPTAEMKTVWENSVEPGGGPDVDGKTLDEQLRCDKGFETFGSANIAHPDGTKSIMEILQGLK